MQHVRLTACYRNQASCALFFSKGRRLRVHPSEEAKVGERGRAQSSQNRFQVDHARIVRRGLRVTGVGYYDSTSRICQRENADGPVISLVIGSRVQWLVTSLSIHTGGRLSA